MATSESKNKTKPFPIAAIGASAGGLEAMSTLLSNLPDKTGIAYVYIQHLDPHHESNLASILQRKTKMPVMEAINKVKVEPDHLYIIPPNKEMSMTDGMLSISPRPESPYTHMPINRFFISLAETYKENSIGIVLSGTATDGTIGLKAIKEHAGITMVQDGTAKFQSMPQSAVNEGAVDLVLSPRQISEELARLATHKIDYDAAIEEAIAEDVPVPNPDILSILKLLQTKVGVDFSNYKTATIRRRIIRRMMLFSLETFEEYIEYFKKNPGETNLLYQDLLINVTAFFRDKECCNYLLKEIIPKIAKSKQPNEPIRVWVPACSTGQEAYTVAMILLEALGEHTTNPIQIFATDLSEAAINKARLGLYKAEEIAEVPNKQLQLYFNKIDGNYRIIKSLRNVCIFATHNLIKDPPFSRMDIISCCNLLIYLNNTLQRRVLSTFHYSLNTHGYMVLGKSESVSTTAHLFNHVNKKLKLYTKKEDTAVNPLFETSYRADVKAAPAQKPIAVQKAAHDVPLERKVQDLLLKEYTPACVLVNSNLDILQFYGSTGLYLEAAPGRASFNLLKMAREGLGFELRNLVHKTKIAGKPVKKQGIEITVNNKLHKVSVEAAPVKNEANEDYYLLVFEEMVISDKEKNYTDLKNARVTQLEEELIMVREDMKSLTAEQEAANEELQSANEEIVSSNEELQSVNEELETSKEEIESSNEELMTMNEELQVRNLLLAEAQEYAEAILFTIRESLIVLDYDFRIKTVNHAFTTTFNLSEADVEGKLFHDINNKLWEIPALSSLLDDIVRHNKEFRDFEVIAKIGNNTKKLVLNAKRLIQNAHRQQLILIAIEDITELQGKS